MGKLYCLQLQVICDFREWQNCKSRLIQNNIDMKKIECKVGVLTKTIRLLPFITIYANPIKAGWKDFAIDIGWLCFAIGMRFNKPSK